MSLNSIGGGISANFPSSTANARPAVQSDAQIPINSNASATYLPREAKIISLLLKNHGIDECEPKVVQQLIDFAYKHVTDILQESILYAEHANRSDILLEDVRLATQNIVNSEFINPPSRQMMMQVAAEKNAIPLPPVESELAVKIPADEFCLLAPHYRVTSLKTSASSNISNLGGNAPGKQHLSSM